MIVVVCNAGTGKSTFHYLFESGHVVTILFFFVFVV